MFLHQGRVATHIRRGGQLLYICVRLLEIYSVRPTVPKITEVGWHSTTLLEKQKVCSFCDTIYL